MLCDLCNRTSYALHATEDGLWCCVCVCCEGHDTLFDDEPTPDLDLDDVPF